MAAQLMAMVMGSGGIASARGRLKGGSGFRMLMRARVEAGAAAAAAGWGVIVVDGGAVGNGGVGAGDDAGGSVAKLYRRSCQTLREGWVWKCGQRGSEVCHYSRLCFFVLGISLH